MSTRDEKPELLKGNISRFNNFDFGTVQSRIIDVSENLLLSGIVSVTPTEGGIVSLFHNATIVHINNLNPYIQLTFLLPQSPKLGQLLILTSNVNISSVIFNGNGKTFGTPMPTSINSGSPIRMVFADLYWILI